MAIGYHARIHAETTISHAVTERPVETEVVYKVGPFDVTAVMLLLFGAFDWGFVGFFDVDPVTAVFGSASPMTHALHSMIGLSSMYVVYLLVRMLKAA